MLNPEVSNKLWGALKARASKVRLDEFSSSVSDSGVRLETFTEKQYRDVIGVEIRRTYYRMVRDETGTVLYDQLEDITLAFATRMESGGHIPDIALSPNRANSLMVEALKQQAEVDRLIAEAKV